MLYLLLADTDLSTGLGFFSLAASHPCLVFLNWCDMAVPQALRGEWFVCGTKWLSGLEIAVFSGVGGKKPALGWVNSVMLINHKELV